MNALRVQRMHRPMMNRCYRPINHQLQSLQCRRVSKIVWDSFGFIKDGTDIKKRASCALWFQNAPYWRFAWGFMLIGPAHFLMYMHGVFDYIFRRRSIPPLPVNWGSEYPFRPPDDYENPLFAPARKWQKIREEKRRVLEENKFNRPFYFKEVTQRPKRHKYRTGGR